MGIVANLEEDQIKICKDYTLEQINTFMIFLEDEFFKERVFSFTYAPLSDFKTTPVGIVSDQTGLDRKASEDHFFDL
jgi:hypothetical protein